VEVVLYLSTPFITEGLGSWAIYTKNKKHKMDSLTTVVVTQIIFNLLTAFLNQPKHVEESLFPFFSLTVVEPPSLSSPLPTVSSTSLSRAGFFTGGATVNQQTFLPLLQDLGGEVGTGAEFLVDLGGIVNKQLTQMLLDGGGDNKLGNLSLHKPLFIRNLNFKVQEKA